MVLRVGRWVGGRSGLKDIKMEVEVLGHLVVVNML